MYQSELRAGGLRCHTSSSKHFHSCYKFHINNVCSIPYWNGIAIFLCFVFVFFLFYFLLSLRHFPTRLLHSWIFSILAGWVLAKNVNLIYSGHALSLALSIGKFTGISLKQR